MKVLVLGSQGMAGHTIVRYLKSNGYAVATAARSSADHHLDVESMLDLSIITNYDYVINCIGLLVKDSINQPDRAILINGWFPHAIENALKNTKTKLIHLSTDCVFDGVKGPYLEKDFHTETNTYGRSKSIGEVNNDKDITFRMSIIGPEINTNGTGLLNWVLTNADSDIPGWENAWWSGITTLQLAKCIEQYMLDPRITGVYHLVNNSNNINKFELIYLINKIYGLNKNVVRTRGPKDINKILLDTQNKFNFQIPDYSTMLAEMRDFL